MNINLFCLYVTYRGSGICLGAFSILPQSPLFSSSPCFMCSYVIPALYQTHMQFQATFTLTSLPPALSESTHVQHCPPLPQTHTPTHHHHHHHHYQQRPWTCLAPPPLLFIRNHQPPQHTPSFLQLPLHAGIPLATVVWWCLPSNPFFSILYGLWYGWGCVWQTGLDGDRSQEKYLTSVLWFCWRESDRNES